MILYLIVIFLCQSIYFSNWALVNTNPWIKHKNAQNEIYF